MKFMLMDKRKLVGTILGSIMFIGVILFFTYAMYMWQSDPTGVVFNINDKYFSCETNIEGGVSGLSSVTDYKSGAYLSFGVDNIGNGATSFSLTMHIKSITENLKSKDLKYKIVVDTLDKEPNDVGVYDYCVKNECTSVGTLDEYGNNGDFSSYGVGTHTFGEPISVPSNVRYRYYLFIYLDPNKENVSLTSADSMSFTLDVCEVVALLDYNSPCSHSPSYKKLIDSDGDGSIDYGSVLALTTPTRSAITVSYNSNGATTNSNPSSVTLAVPEFQGWYLDETFTSINKIDATKTVSSNSIVNHNLYAKWSSGGSATLPTVTKTGYTFNGWYNADTKIGMGGATFNPYEKYCSDLGLNASWMANVYDVNYSLNGGSFDSDDSHPASGTYDTDIKVTKPTKTVIVTGDANSTGASVGSATSKAQTFAGWTSSEDNGLITTTAKYGSAASPSTSWSGSAVGSTYDNTYFKNLRKESGTVTLTANWTAVAMTLPTVTKDGYTCGWNESFSGTTIQYESGGSYTPKATSSASVTLYAVCKANTATVTINKNGSAWSSSGMNVALYSGTTSVYAYSTGEASGSTVTFGKENGVKAGTYNVYAGKSSNAKTTLLDTGVDITITNGTTSAGTGEATINYYDLTLVNGTGISAVSNGGTSTTNAVQYLYNSSSPQSIAIDATVSSGYAWETWTKTSGTNLKTFTAETKSQNVQMGAGATTLTASATDSQAPTPSPITVSDCDTFTYTFSDNIGVTGYYVSTSNTTPKASDDGWVTTTSKSFTLGATATTYYVWAKDAAGNVSSVVSKSLVKVSRTQGTGTTLTTRYNSTSSSTGTNFTTDIYVLSGSTCNVWAKAEANTGYGSVVLKRGGSEVDNPSYAAVTAAVTIESSATDSSKPSKPTITRSDYNTFTYASSDNVGVTGYYVSAVNTSTAPTTNSTWVTTTTKDINAAGTYYVWARDAAGNISEEAASITAYTIKRSQGTGTTLTTRYDSTSSSTGTKFTTDTIVLAGTPIWAKVTANTGYGSLSLKHGSTSMTVSGATFNVSASETITSSAKVTTTITPSITEGSVEVGKTNSFTVTVTAGNGAAISGTLELESYSDSYYTLSDSQNGTYEDILQIEATTGNTYTIYYKGINEWDAEVVGLYFYPDDTNYVDSSNTTVYIEVTADVTKPSTPTITRSDYNTFTYSSTDSAGVACYYVSQSSSTPTAPTSACTTSTATTYNTWTTTTTKDITLAGTYFVWAVDAAGNISSSKSIAAYTISRSQGTGTTLTTRYDSTSSSTGMSFTSNTVVLAGTPIWAKATANSGYNGITLKHGSTSMTASGGTFNASASETITSTTTANVVKVNIYKDGAAWSASGIKVTLYNGTTTTSYTATVSSGSQATISAVPNGTYNIYAGKSSLAKTTLLDSGVDVTVSNNSPSAVTVNYYTLTLTKGTGISSVSNAGQTSTLAVQHLYNSSDPQSIAIDATVSSGYTWSQWTKTSGTNLKTFLPTSKTHTVKMGAGAATLTASAKITTTITPSITEGSVELGKTNSFTVTVTAGNSAAISGTLEIESYSDSYYTLYDPGDSTYKDIVQIDMTTGTTKTIYYKGIGVSDGEMVYIYFWPDDSSYMDSYNSDVYIAVTADVTKPEAGIDSTNTVKSSTQTAEFTCIDEVGVKSYYLGTTAPTASTTYTELSESTPEFSIEQTINKASTVGTTTHYFACKDAEGNVSTTANKSYTTFFVRNMLLRADGEKGTYNTSEYYGVSSYTYIYSGGYQYSDFYTIPDGADASTFVGMSWDLPSTTSVSDVSTVEDLKDLGSVTPVTDGDNVMWFDRIEYTISYDTKGGSGVFFDVTKRYGVDITLSTKEPTKSGYNFLGWSTSSTATTATYQPGATYTANAGTTLYAVWEHNGNFCEVDLLGSSSIVFSPTLIAASGLYYFGSGYTSSCEDSSLNEGITLTDVYTLSELNDLGYGETDFFEAYPYVCIGTTNATIMEYEGCVNVFKITGCSNGTCDGTNYVGSIYEFVNWST